ncbi:MAG: hypothetical protein DSZ10_05440, partial [Sulfurovum sp.]
DKKCCDMKDGGKSKERSCECKTTLNHLSRIEGQIRALKQYIEEGKRCKDVAMLSASIAKSFDTLRARTLKNFILNEVLGEAKIQSKKEEEIEEILKLYKK